MSFASETYHVIAELLSKTLKTMPKTKINIKKQKSSNFKNVKLGITTLKITFFCQNFSDLYRLFLFCLGQALAAALMDNNVLTSLDLSWNILGKQAASALGKALKVCKKKKKSEKNLKRTSVSYSRKI